MKPKEPTKRYRRDLNYNDEQALIQLSRYHYMTAQQLARRLGIKSVNYVQRESLKMKLVEMGYVETSLRVVMTLSSIV